MPGVGTGDVAPMIHKGHSHPMIVKERKNFIATGNYKPHENGTSPITDPLIYDT